jgi:hypothetical protein
MTTCPRCGGALITEAFFTRCLPCGREWRRRGANARDRARQRAIDSRFDRPDDAAEILEQFLDLRRARVTKA